MPPKSQNVISPTDTLALLIHHIHLCAPTWSSQQGSNAALAIFGNIEGEAAKDPSGNFICDGAQRGGGGGKGLFQFDGCLREAYEIYSRGDWSAGKQIDFAFKCLFDRNYREIIGPDNADKILAAMKNGSTKEAVQAFMDRFERPGVLKDLAAHLKEVDKRTSLATRFKSFADELMSSELARAKSSVVRNVVGNIAAAAAVPALGPAIYRSSQDVTAGHPVTAVARLFLGAHQAFMTGGITIALLGAGLTAPPTVVALGVGWILNRWVYQPENDALDANADQIG